MNNSTSNRSFHSLAHIALFAALIAAFGLIPKVDLPFGVPITLQTLGVMLAGCLLGARRGFLAVGLFLLMVATGLPLLAGGRGGLGVFFAPSAGFLIGWPFGAAACGFVMRYLPHRPGGRVVWLSAVSAAFVGGVVVVYAFGISGLVLIAHLSWVQAAIASTAFIPGDLLKCAICSALVQSVARGLPSWRLAD